MLEGLLRSAYPLHETAADDREEPRFQSIVVGPASASRSSSLPPPPPGPIPSPATATAAEAKPGGTVVHREAASDPPHERDIAIAGEDHDDDADDPARAFVGDHLLLEIAAGASGPTPAASSSPDDGTVVVAPGSLRTRGEFCLVDLVWEEELEESSSPETGRDRRWRVERTHFHRLEPEGNGAWW